VCGFLEKKIDGIYLMSYCRLMAMLTCKAKTDNDFRENIMEAAI